MRGASASDFDSNDGSLYIFCGGVGSASRSPFVVIGILGEGLLLYPRNHVFGGSHLVPVFFFFFATF